MEDLQIFTNEEFGTVRGMLIDDEPWFVGKDVAEVLGYESPSAAVSKKVEPEDRGFSKMETPSGIQEMTIINESGLYGLIMSSRLPEAKKFKRWVTAEVLPAIRKTGGYTIDSYQIEDPIERAKRWIEEQAEKKVLESKIEAKDQQIAVQNQQIAELQPKASYYDIVLNAPNLVATSVIAKDYGWSAQRLNEFLHKSRIQYKQGKIWLLYQQYAELGLTSTKTHAHPAPDGTLHTSIFTYWTPRGRLFIYDLLKQNDILPIIERMGRI